MRSLSPRQRVWLWLLLPLVAGGCWSYLSKEAQQRFNAAQRPISVTVFPVNVVKGRSVDHDAELGRKLAHFLRREGLAAADPGIAPVALPVQWHSNQAKMAQESAQGFAAWIRGSGIATDYGLLAEILCDPGETQVIGVHFYLAERNGALASGGLTNSHWEEFEQVRPHDRSGGYQVLERMLLKQWRRD